MRKSFLLLLLLVFSFSAPAQRVSEKKIAGYSSLTTASAYDFKYDNSTGTYFYSAYDSVTQKYTVYSNKGNSAAYNYIEDYSGLFDPAGNYYVTANNNVDSFYTYYMLKNGAEVASYEFIDPMWDERDGIIYFSCREDGKAYFVEYSTSDGSMKKSTPYDEIYFVYYPMTYYDAEPMGTVGFTPDGKAYYAASSGDEKFLVIGGVEQKHYSDIGLYTFEPDNSGVMTYFAKDKGKFYEEKGNTFVVQGDKEYNKFDYVYGPLLFDKDNTPIYIASDSAGGYIYPQRVVTGNTEGKTYTSGIYDIKLTPDGKLAYVATNVVDYDKGIYESYLVMDNVEGKPYRYISYLSFLPDGTPVYFGNQGMNKPGAIVIGAKEIKTKYPDLYELKVLEDGSLSYVEVKYGNYEKNEKDRYRVVIGNKSFGPYDGIVGMYWNNGSYVITDKNGNYAYITMKLVDAERYEYENKLYSNTAKSRKAVYFDNVYILKGKVLYTASRLVDKMNYFYENQLYYGNKKIGSVYNTIADFKLDEKTGTASFRAVKGKDFYFVEVKF